VGINKNVFRVRGQRSRSDELTYVDRGITIDDARVVAELFIF